MVFYIAESHLLQGKEIPFTKSEAISNSKKDKNDILKTYFPVFPYLILLENFYSFIDKL